MPTDWNISRLKQKLKDGKQVLEGLPPERRRLAWLGIGGAGLLLVYLVLVSPLLSLEDSWSQELASQRQVLAKYQSLAAGKKVVQEANQALKRALVQTESQFLAGNNPAVASSDLQDIIKNLARDHGVQLTSTKTLPTREAGPYLEVPVQVQLTAGINQALTIIYNLEHHKKLLFIPELEINAPRWAKAEKGQVALQINLVISGVMRKGVAS